MLKKAIFIIFLVIDVWGQQFNESTTTEIATPAMTSTTTSQPITTGPSNTDDIKSYSSGLTPQLMRLLDEPVEADETESIFPFEKINIVAFPRINLQTDNEGSTVGPEDTLKVEQRKLESFLQNIAANSDSFTSSKQSYGSLGKVQDEEMQMQPSSLLKDAKFFTPTSNLQIHSPIANFHNYPSYFNTREAPTQQQQMLPLMQEEFMVAPDCCSPCPPFQPVPIQLPCCQDQPTNHCGHLQANPSEIQLPGGLGTITERDVDEFVDNLLERKIKRQQAKRFGQQSLSQDNNYDGVYNSKYFEVHSKNQMFHSPPRGFGALTTVKLTSGKKSEEKLVNSGNETKNEGFNPNFKFFYQFGDGNLSESKTALYHVNQLKTKQPTVISLKPTTTDLLKMLNSQAHGLNMVEVPFEEEDLEEDAPDANSQNRTVV